MMKLFGENSTEIAPDFSKLSSLQTGSNPRNIWWMPRLFILFKTRFGSLSFSWHCPKPRVWETSQRLKEELLLSIFGHRSSTSLFVRSPYETSVDCLQMLLPGNFIGKVERSCSTNSSCNFDHFMILVHLVMFPTKQHEVRPVGSLNHRLQFLDTGKPFSLATRLRSAWNTYNQEWNTIPTLGHLSQVNSFSKPQPFSKAFLLKYLQK